PSEPPTRNRLRRRSRRSKRNMDRSRYFSWPCGVYSDRPRGPSATLLHFAETENLRAALHVLAHLPAERLEVVGGAMGVHGSLVDIALHEDVGGRCLASVAVPAVERVERAAGLVG